MATTKRKIADQAYYIIKESDPAVASNIDLRDLMELVGQAANSLLKAEYYGPHIQSGEVAAAGLVIGTYEGIKVAESGNYSKIKLPCMPVKLLKNQGLYEIAPDGDFFGYYRFIPVPVGLGAGVIKGISFTNNVLGHIYYMNTNLDVVFSRNIVLLDKIEAVRVRLVVADVSSLSEYDPLPVPADMEIEILRNVLSFYNLKPSERVTDISADKPAMK